MGIEILTCHCDFELLHLLSFRAVIVISSEARNLSHHYLKISPHCVR